MNECPRTLTDLPTPHPILPTETKNQWARDDPAFVVLTAAMVFVVSILYCLFYSHSFGQAVYAVLRSVLVDFLGVGAGVATAYWFVANRYMREPGVNHSHAVEQQVEWMYAFDVHVNAFFTLLPSLYCGQLVLSPLLMMNGFIPRLLSGALYGVALSYYHYCVFIGYNALPFLEHTALLVYPIAVIALVTPLAVLVGFNPTRFTLGIYFH